MKGLDLKGDLPAGVRMNQDNTFEIGYIMKGYPRNTDVFITNEIYLLQEMGLKLRVFSIWKPHNKKSHSIEGKVNATVTYLPEAANSKSSKFLIWLWINFPKFIGSHFRLFRLRPSSYLQVWFEAVRMALRYRSSFFPRCKKVFFKDFLRAGYIALRVLESGRIYHLHAHFCHGSATMGMFVSQLTGIPYSFTAHAKDIYLKELNPGDLLQTKIRKAQFVVTCTGFNRTYLKRLCPEVASIHTIYHGLDTMLFTPTEQQEDCKALPLILSVGRFIEKKGFVYMIKACQQLKDKGYLFKYQIVGEADEQTDRIKQLIKELNLEDTVSLSGTVSQEELRQINNKCTIFVLPCLIVENGDRDGIPNVLVEAMAMEIPVISTNISGIPELIEHQTDGLLVPQKDASALAEAIEDLLQNPALRKQLGKAAREKICRLFDSKKTTVALKTLFLSCLDRHG